MPIFWLIVGISAGIIYLIKDKSTPKQVYPKDTDEICKIINNNMQGARDKNNGLINQKQLNNRLSSGYYNKK